MKTYTINNLIQDLKSCKDSYDCNGVEVSKPVVFDFAWFVPLQLGLVESGIKSGKACITFATSFHHTVSPSMILDKFQKALPQKFVYYTIPDEPKFTTISVEDELLVVSTINNPLVGTKVVGLKDTGAVIVLLTETIL